MYWNRRKLYIHLMIVFFQRKSKRTRVKQYTV